MISENEINEVRKIIEELLVWLGADGAIVVEQGTGADVVLINIRLKEPSMLIGQSGQSLISLQRIAGIVAGRRLKKNIYLNIDINDYKKEKIAYLENMAQEAADEVARTNVAKTLPPMSSYERRIIHAKLAQRADVTTRSQGEGEKRFIVISPRQ